MPSISESLDTQSQMAEGLAAGVGALSLNQQIMFTTYARSTIPIDGYVFYVNSGQTTTVDGSLHYAIDRQQNEDETNDVSRVVFTALSQIDVFNQASPDTLFVGSWNGIQFAFNGRGPYYQQSGLFHYAGYKVSPALASQLIDSAADLPTGPIVSNSLPIWLAPNSFAPVYPSYLVPANVAPPYVSAHVEPDMTEGAHFPIVRWPGAAEAGTDPAPLHLLPSYQLAKDRVRLTLYGFTNQMAIQYLASLIQLSYSEVFGFGNTPVVRDHKRGQAELTVIAMKKTIDIDAWYYQTTADALARRLILSAELGTITTQ